jgi:hypothetical protein
MELEPNEKVMSYPPTIHPFLMLRGEKMTNDKDVSASLFFSLNLAIWLLKKIGLLVTTFLNLKKNKIKIY